MNIREEGVPEKVTGYIRAGAQDAVMFFGAEFADAEPAKIVNAIDDVTRRWQTGYRPAIEDADDPVNAAWIFGSLWGQQIVRQFGWGWAKLTWLDSDNAVAFGVVSPDRSLVVYPMNFVEAFMRDANMDVTVMLSFNMLLANASPAMPPRSYTNMMNYVQRVVR